MEDSLVQSYNKTALITRAWDEVQTRLRCCSVSDKGWALYRNSYWIANVMILLKFNMTISGTFGVIQSIFVYVCRVESLLCNGAPILLLSDYRWYNRLAQRHPFEY